MSLDQARGLGVEALRKGDAAFALQLGYGLLQADPQDAFAHFLIASAFQLQSKPNETRKAAALAYRYADSKAEKFEAAQLAAIASVEQDQFSRAQVWLRRSLLHASDPRFIPKIEEDYRRVRALNPMELRFNFTLAPSSNVNNGSDSPYALIDGVQLVGLLDGLSQALSGVVASGDLALSYRLSGSATHETRALGRLYASRVWLDSDGRQLANSFPGSDVSNGDFAFTALEGGLRHALRPGGAEGRFLFAAEAVTGRNWYAGNPYQRFERLGLSGGVTLTSGMSLTLAGELEQRRFDHLRHRSVDTRSMSGTLAQILGNGDRVGLSLSMRDSDSDTPNANATRNTAYLQYTMAEPLGPVRLALTLGAAAADYPDFQVGFIQVPGGRADETIFGSVDIVFDQFDYAGFVPSIMLRGQKTRSNVSRFATSEVAISFGIRSRF